jgi:hypothetical protein
MQAGLGAVLLCWALGVHFAPAVVHGLVQVVLQAVAATATLQMWRVARQEQQPGEDRSMRAVAEVLKLSLLIWPLRWVQGHRPRCC